MNVDIKHFDQLTTRELYDVLWLRDLVFVVGQKITSEPEVDGLDPECHHAMLRRDHRVIGTARIFASRNPIVVGRVAVHGDFQKQGLGTELMRQVQQWIGNRPAELHAQAHLEPWYTTLGWRRVGDVFIEAEIPHVTMVLDPAT